MKKNFFTGLIIVFIIILGYIFYTNNNPINNSSKNIKTQEFLCKDCNVIMVAFDALQAAHVSHLGYDRVTTPTIDSIAKEGVTFSQAISVASWTVPSYMSIFTGLSPTEHKVVNKYSVFTEKEKVVANLAKLSPQVRTLAQVFKDNGYITGGFTGDAGVSSPFGYNQGFDVYKDNETFGSMEKAATQAAQWIRENKGKKFFLFLHGYDMHGQFQIPPGYSGRFMSENYPGSYKGTPQEQRDLREKGLTVDDIGLTPDDVGFWRSWYDSKIADADDRFKKFWDEFEAMGLRDNTVVVLFSDHGTEFYEHRKFDHGHTLYDELVHVPLVISAPKLPKDKRIDAQVATIDIAPTVLELSGIRPDNAYTSQIRGKSLIPLIMDQPFEQKDIFLETDYRNYTHKRGIRTSDGWKYIETMETGKEELYNLRTDPSEETNLAGENLEKANELKQRVEKHIEDMGGNPKGPWDIGCLPVYGDQCK